MLLSDSTAGSRQGSWERVWGKIGDQSGAQQIFFFFFFAEMFLTTNTLTVIGGGKEFITKFESDVLDTFCKSH